RRQRFSFEEVPGVLVCAARRLTVGALRHRAFGASHVCLLRSVELGGRESKPSDALEFGREGVEASCHTVIRDECLNDRLVPCPRGREERPIRSRVEEGRLLPLTELLEPRAEHRTEQLIEQDLAIAAD